MKMLLVVLAVVLSTSAFAQKHMVSVDAGELVGVLNWSTSKDKGQSSQEDKSRDLTLNYAYTLTSYLQVGGKLNYSKNTYTGGSDEDYGFQVGAIYNHGADIRSAYYASLYTGLNWQNGYGTNHYHAEVLSTTVAAGKRIPLTKLGLENVVYSPELSWTSQNPTTTVDVEWQQDLRVKFLNFSVFF